MQIVIKQKENEMFYKRNVQCISHFLSFLKHDYLFC